MTRQSTDGIEECAQRLLHEIEKLEKLDLTFAASLVRIAHLDLQMRLHKVTEDEMNVLSFAEIAVDNERRARVEALRRESKSEVCIGGVRDGSE